MRRLTSYAVALATALALVATGSTAPVVADDARRLGPKVAPFQPQSSDNARLRDAWDRWVDARGTRYVTRVARTCGECSAQPPVIRTEVRGKRLASVRNLTNDKSVGWGWGWPIERAYRLLRRGYQKADKVYVKYDKRGVPVTIGIDWSTMIADEETYLSVRAKVG